MKAEFESFPHIKLIETLGYTILAVSLTYFGYLGVQSDMKLSQAASGALVTIVWAVYILIIHELWAGDGENSPD